MLSGILKRLFLRSAAVVRAPVMFVITALALANAFAVITAPIASTVVFADSDESAGAAAGVAGLRSASARRTGAITVTGSRSVAVAVAAATSSSPAPIPALRLAVTIAAGVAGRSGEPIPVPHPFHARFVLFLVMPTTSAMSAMRQPTAMAAVPLIFPRPPMRMAPTAEPWASR